MAFLALGKRTIQQLPGGVELAPLDQDVGQVSVAIRGVERRLANRRITRPVDVLLGSQQLSALRPQETPEQVQDAYVVEISPRARRGDRSRIGSAASSALPASVEREERVHAEDLVFGSARRSPARARQ